MGVHSPLGRVTREELDGSPGVVLDAEAGPQGGPDLQQPPGLSPIVLHDLASDGGSEGGEGSGYDALWGLSIPENAPWGRLIGVWCHLPPGRSSVAWWWWRNLCQLV